MRESNKSVLIKKNQDFSKQAATSEEPQANSSNEPLPLSHLQESRRATRRRNISFYQQHIYTIDSVSYILKISLQDATELVKQRTEIIEMYHRGCLEKFLKNGFKLPEPVTVRKTIVQTNDDSQSSDSQDYGSDNESYSSSSSEESVGELPVSPKLQDKAVKFRGHIYKNLDAVSRASGLPKSFFSIEGGTSAHKSVSKKRVSNEIRPGLAKRKKYVYSPNNSFGNDVFTTEDNIQKNENLPQESGSDCSSEIPESAIDLASNGLILGDNHVYDQSVAGETYQSGSETDVLVLDERQKEFSLENEQPMFQTTINDNSVFYKVGYSPGLFGDEAEVARAEIDPMLNHTRADRKQKNLQKSNLSRSKNLHSKSVLLTSSLFQRKTHKASNTRSLKRVSNSRSINRSKPQTSLQPSEKKLQPQSSPDKQMLYKDHNGHLSHSHSLKGLKQSVFSLSPNPENLFSRNVGASTLVYEGLSHRFALLNQSNQQNFGDEYGSSDFTGDSSSTSKTYRFYNSKIFKLMKNNELQKDTGEAKVTLGKKSFMFTKLFGDSSEKLIEFFRGLLDVSLARNKSNVIECVDTVLSFCVNLDNSEIRSLVGIVDNFKISVESNIMRKGHVKDIEFFYLSVCTLAYDLCFQILTQNYIHGYDFMAKVSETTRLYLEFACNLGGQLFDEKLHESGLFSYSMEIMCSNSFDAVVKALPYIQAPDMKFIESICVFAEIKKSIWGPVSKVLSYHINKGDLNNIAFDIFCVGKLSFKLNWILTEEILSLVYEALKVNRFNNFPGESSLPVIFSEKGINKDSSLNIYLNLLMEYSKDSPKLSSKFLDKLVPVSKSSSMNITTFCNRGNMLLCLALVFHKNFESRIDELLQSFQLDKKDTVQKSLKLIEACVKINQENKLVSSVRSLEPVLRKCLELKDYDGVTSLIRSLNFKSLDIKTQRNIIIRLSSFKSEQTILRICEPLIREYVSSVSGKEELALLKHHLGDINSNSFPGLWCCINGKLVAEDLENWSRLIKFSDFTDEPFIFSYILRHSGAKIYQLERDRFLVSLIQNLVKRTYSSSLNSYLREVEKFDSKLVNFKGILVQTHRFEITVGLILNVLNNESDYIINMLLSSMLKFVLSELSHPLNEADNHYKSLVKRIAKFLQADAVKYLVGMKEFEELAKELGFVLSSATAQKALEFKKEDTAGLKTIERKLLASLSNSEVLDGVLFNKNLFRSQRSGSFDISNSSFYAISCFISFHAELLASSPLCWALLSKITDVLSVMLQSTRSFHQIDIYCLAKTIKLFHFVFKHKKKEYYNYQLLTNINIYRVLYALFEVVEGTNDFFVFYDLSFVFMSTSLIFDNEIPEIDNPFIAKVPQALSEIVKGANFTPDTNMDSENLQRTLLYEYEIFLSRFRFKMEIEDQNTENEGRVQSDSDLDILL